MKSPVQTNWFSLIVCGLGGLGLDIYLTILETNNGQTINLFQIGCLLALLAIFLILGWSLSVQTQTILNRPVKHPVDPKNLIKDQIYWLNGETHATFIDVNDYSGKYIFNIFAVGPKSVLPGEVRQYFSAEEEIEEPKK